MPWSSDPAETVSLMFLSQSRSLGESEARTARHQPLPLESWVAQEGPLEDEKEKLELLFLFIFIKERKLTFISRIWIKRKSYTSYKHFIRILVVCVRNIVGGLDGRHSSLFLESTA